MSNLEARLNNVLNGFKAGRNRFSHDTVEKVSYSLLLGLRDELRAGCANPAVKVKALLRAWVQWEADIILNGDWTNETVRLTQEQHDNMIEMQTERNRILAALEVV